jgi:BirA family biotin operon repressor/biotin-[acetyl-CoA-carboxylase] ligase
LCVATFAFLSTSRRAVSLSTSRQSSTTNPLFMPTDLFLDTNKYVLLQHSRDAVNSTQDEARRFLHAAAINNISTAKPCFAVLADQQLYGRGTHGRAWESGTGNLYLTVAVPMTDVPVLITLLPLQMAVLVAHQIQQQFAVSCNSAAKVTVKWPNDVLINDLKVSGTIIEHEIVDGASYLLIGVGVNVVQAPVLVESTRGATSLQQHCGANALLPTSALEFGCDLVRALAEWIYEDNEGLSKLQKEYKVLSDWRSLAELGKVYELRGNEGDEHCALKGKKVVTVDIEQDGQLRVREEDGRERLLVAEYLI